MHKLALVLSGGGAKGAYEAGALSTIAKQSADIKIVTGASIGAINAAIFACTYEETGDQRQAAEKVKDLWLDIGPLFRFHTGVVILKLLLSALRNWSLSVPALFSFDSLVSTHVIRQKVDELIPDIKISQLERIDLSINGTNLTTGRTVSFNRKNDANIRDAVMASSCLPILFPPVQINGESYVDGGVFNNTPLKDALVLGATRAIIVALKPKDSDVYRSEIVDEESYESVFNVSTRLVELILDKIMYEDLKNARRTNAIISVIRQMEAQVPSEVLERLKEAIAYHKFDRIKRETRTKREVELVDIAPSGRLDPPGTLGFDDAASIRRLIEMGERDAEEQMPDVSEDVA